MSVNQAVQERRLVGWREWLSLPALGVPLIKAKIDTGARSSALHAFNLSDFARDGATWLRFEVHPLQRDNQTVIQAEAELLEWRWIRSSSGHRQRRPVILTPARIDGVDWPIEMTLTSRDKMGFRMLLGRQALRGRWWVDPGRSYLINPPPPRSLKPKKRKSE